MKHFLSTVATLAIVAGTFAAAAGPTWAETPDDQRIIAMLMSNIPMLDPAAITGRDAVAASFPTSPKAGRSRPTPCRSPFTCATTSPARPATR